MRFRPSLLVALALAASASSSIPASAQVAAPPQPVEPAPPASPAQPVPPQPPGEDAEAGSHVEFELRGGGVGGFGIGGGGADRPVIAMRGAQRAPAEKGAFLGVATSSPQEGLRQQLKLHKGTGLVVDFVEPDSPAAKAGLKQYDVMTKLNDQLLINAQQLAVLVRTFKPDEEVTLTVVREGQPVQLKTKLAERDLPALDDFQLWQHDPQWFGQMRLPNVRAVPARPGQPPMIVVPPPQVAPDPQPPRAQNFRFPRRFGEPGAARTVTTWTDGEHTLTVTATPDGKGRRLICIDRNGTELFNGSIDTQEQRDKLPTIVADKLKKLEAVSVPRSPQPGQPPQPAQPGADPQPGEDGKLGGEGANFEEIDVRVGDPPAKT